MVYVSLCKIPSKLNVVGSSPIARFEWLSVRVANHLQSLRNYIIISISVLFQDMLAHMYDRVLYQCCFAFKIKSKNPLNL